MNKQQLANRIWEAANKMRSKIEANEYKDYILGFIFYKFLSETEVNWLKANDWEEEDIKELSEDDLETVEYVQKNIGYFISYDNLYSTWLANGNKFDAANVTEALSDFSRLIHPNYKKVYDGVFETLETGLSKLGTSNGERTKAIMNLLQLIKDIPMNGKQDYDVLGFIYEYLIGQFAANAGKKAGEFYTPHEVSQLMSEIVANHLKDKKEIKIYDPTSGSGSLLINIGRSVSRFIDGSDNIKYYAQELKQNTYNLTRMNLVMRGIKPDNIVTRNADTLEDDWPYFDENNKEATYDPLFVDAVVSNPPYSQAWDPSNKENDPRYASFGLAPKGKADFAFLLHDLYHVKDDGIMTIVLPHGVLFRGGEEGEIRKNLIEFNHIDAIIGLPANIFFGTGIPTIILVLKKHRTTDDVLIVDASKGFEKVGKNNVLRASDIKRAVDTVVNRKTIEKYSRLVSKEEIRANDYNLNIPRYVDSSEAAETWDIYASMFGGIPVAELDALHEYWDAFPTLRKDLFKDNGTPYVDLVSDDVKDAIKNHSDILAFSENFKQNFDGFDEFLEEKLLSNMETIHITQGEIDINNNIFERLENTPLVDKYNAYQLLDDTWKNVSVDLEIIQSEGFEVTRKVDPNMISKKVKGVEEEVQDGWVGRILPFELVQKNLLSEQLEKLNTKEDRLASIPSEFEELAELLTEEEKEAEFFNEDSFVNKEVTKKLKELKKETDEDLVSLREKLQKVEALINEEKALKKAIKEEKATLESLTKETIESLTDEQVYALLHVKWIDEFIANLYKMPNSIIDNLVKKVEELKTKYETTYADLEKEIKETEESLCSLIDELTGDEFDMKGLSEFKSLLLGE